MLALGLLGVLLTGAEARPAPLAPAELSAVTARPSAGVTAAMLNLSVREGQASPLAPVRNVATSADPRSVSQARTQIAVRVSLGR